VNREELAALRDALDAVLTWPDSGRIELARWLMPEAATPGNGPDTHPPPGAATPAKARPSEALAKDKEQKLLAAIQANPGLSATALARASAAAKATVQDRLKRLAARGAIEQDAGGRWRLAGDGARPTQPPLS
jgi:hypothetical protein